MERTYPREKLLKLGAQNLTDSELIAIILRKGTKGKSVFEISKELMKKFGSLYNLFRMDIKDLVRIKGLGLVGAITLKAAFELGKRYHFEYIAKHNKDRIKIKDYFDIYEMNMDLIYEDREIVRLISLDSKYQVLSVDDISVGTVNNTLVHPREIFKKAIERNAVYIIILHNHPTGDSTPSIRDIDVTEALFKASEILGIKIVDHVIIGKGEIYTFKKRKRVVINEWKRSGYAEKDFGIEKEI